MPDSPPRRSESWAEAVADGNSETAGPAGAELIVIVNEVQVGFRPDKQISPDVVAKARAEVPVEMIAADVICAAHKTARISSLIEPKVLAADSSHQLGPELLPQLRGPYTVKVIKYRAIRLVSAIVILSGSPCGLALYADMMAYQNIGAEAGIQPAPIRREKYSGRVSCSCGRCERAETEGSVKLLRLGRALHHDENA